MQPFQTTLDFYIFQTNWHLPKETRTFPNDPHTAYFLNHLHKSCGRDPTDLKVSLLVLNYSGRKTIFHTFQLPTFLRGGGGWQMDRRAERQRDLQMDGYRMAIRYRIATLAHILIKWGLGITSNTPWYHLYKVWAHFERTQPIFKMIPTQNKWIPNTWTLRFGNLSLEIFKYVNLEIFGT